jgi:prolipoprotein diacylglyceryltransferase
MKSLMIIDTTHGGIFFSLTYLAAFLLVAIMMIHEGFRKNYPRSAWLLIVLCGVISFIIGDKLFSYSPEQWLQVFTKFEFAATEKKTVLGGIVGLFAGIFLAKMWLRFDRPVLDTMAVAMPIAMAISRIGCLMAGCCFGTPTTLPWGIHYGTASWAYHVHQSQGLLDLHDMASLPVHPAQLYQVAGCLIIAFLVWMTRKYWKSNGNLFLFSVLSYLVLRCLVEFVRAPETNSYAGQVVYGLKLIQWLIAAAVIPGCVILYLREKKRERPSVIFNPAGSTEFRLFLLSAILCGFVLFARKWFTFLEYSTILLFFIPVISVVFVKLYRRYFIAGFRQIVPLLVVCCFSFMAQKIDQGGKKDTKTTFTEFGLSGMVGRYFDNLNRVSDDQCDVYSTTPAGSDKRTFYQGGFDCSYNIWHGKYNKLAFGGRVFLGSETGDIEMDYPHSRLTYGISPFFNINWRWFGLGTGFTVGQMKLSDGLSVEFTHGNGGINRPHHTIGNVISSGYFNRNFILSLSARVGPSDIFYMEGSYPGLFPSSTPFPSFQVGFGSGLGKTNGTKLGIGVCDDGFYSEVNYPFKNNIVLKAFYADNFFSGTKTKRILSVGISYRLMSGKAEKK